MSERRDGLTRPTEAEIRQGGFSTPWDAPSVPPFPFRFRGAEILTLFYRTDPQAAAFLLPPPLEPAGDVAAIHIYRMNDPGWLGPYHECNVMIPAQLPGAGITGGYSPWLFLASDGGVSHGREVHGQPKKLAAPWMEFRGDLIAAGVVRNGIEVITGTMAYKQRAADPAVLSAHFDISVNLNLKAIDHIDGHPAIRQITARRLTEVSVHECWAGPCTVELRPNAQAPVHRLPVLEMLEGVFWRADFTLVPGDILHDYLSDGP